MAQLIIDKGRIVQDLLSARCSAGGVHLAVELVPHDPDDTQMNTVVDLAAWKPWRFSGEWISSQVNRLGYSVITCFSTAWWTHIPAGDNSGYGTEGAPTPGRTGKPDALSPGRDVGMKSKSLLGHQC